MPDQVKIYVFGSCHFSGRLESDDAIGNGGYGVVININGIVVYAFSDGYSNTTNARMEIMGIMDSLNKITEPSDITVYSKNGYVVNTLSKGWLQSWKEKGYKKKKNVDLWKKLEALLSETPHSISFKHSSVLNDLKDMDRAEHLGKQMSKNIGLPMDMQDEPDNSLNMFLHVNLPSAPLPLETNKPIPDAVCVDASCIENPGKMEYRGVEMKTGKILFEKAYEEATNNIGEFLAIVHAIALFKKEGKELKVLYSDSLNAISWVRQKKCKTKLVPNEKNAIVFKHIQRAIVWLNSNEYDTQILKWDTEAWGEIPADYGRK